MYFNAVSRHGELEQIMKWTDRRLYDWFKICNCHLDRNEVKIILKNIVQANFLISFLRLWIKMEVSPSSSSPKP